MSKPEKKPFPKTLLCRWEYDRNDEENPFLLVDEDAANFAEPGETIRASRYIFKEEVEVTAEPTIVTVEKTG